MLIVYRPYSKIFSVRHTYNNKLVNTEINAILALVIRLLIDIHIKIPRVKLQRKPLDNEKRK